MLPVPNCSVPPELIVMLPVPAMPVAAPLPSCSTPPLMMVGAAVLAVAKKIAVPVPLLVKPIVLPPPRIMPIVPA